MASEAKTMLAVVFRKFGSPDVLQIEAWKKPKRQPGEVLVKMSATSVNPVDVKQRGGKFKPPLVYKLPKIPGGDVAGYVEDTDTSISRFRRGDRVYGLSDTYSPFRAEGTYAEMTATKETFLTETPSNIEDDVAGATPLVALTALQALEPADLKSGDRVLVHGGSGGVGHVAVQLAKLKGAFVATTCSAEHADFCRGIGADEVVDYKKERFDLKYAHSPFDAVIDTVGGTRYWLANMKVLKRGGYYGHILVGSWIPGLPFFINAQLEGIAAGLGYARAFLTGGRYKLVFVEPSGSQMRTIARLQEEGKLAVKVAGRFPLEKASAAHHLLEEGHPPGKVVITIPPRGERSKPGA